MQERKELYTERFLREWRERIEKSRTPRGDSKINTERSFDGSEKCQERKKEEEGKK